MRHATITIGLVISGVFLSGCAGLDFSAETTRATIGYTTAIHDDLISLPKPKEKIVVATYKFRDQTGQYKTSAAATTFSTAVSQGATSMLNKALEDSGWFITIEREGLANLLNERSLIRSTRLQYQAEGRGNMPPLPPLLYAGVLLEGGIIAYDTNFITGGLGVRYYGVGGSGKLQKDRVTIYLRLVSTRNGQILKSISTTKSILSKEVDFGVYRFVSVQRLLEAEAGFSTNEPSSICILEAIEKGVHDLIIEGILDDIWTLENPEDINCPAIQNYRKEKEKAEKLVTFDEEGNVAKVEDIEEPMDVGKPETIAVEKNESGDAAELEPGLIKRPTIHTFDTTPPRIWQGDGSTLTWRVSNAVRISIEPGIGPVSASGSEIVSPPATTTYTIIAANEAGESRETCSIEVVTPNK